MTCTADPSTPNAVEVQKALFYLEREILAPYELPPNRLSRDLYDNLILPLDLGDEYLAKQFPVSEFLRMEWDRDGALTGEDFFDGSKDAPLNDLANGFTTASMVTRWREAHPDLVGTDRDCVIEAMARVREALGVGIDENPPITVGGATALLLFKRR